MSYAQVKKKKKTTLIILAGAFTLRKTFTYPQNWMVRQGFGATRAIHTPILARSEQ